MPGPENEQAPLRGLGAPEYYGVSNIEELNALVIEDVLWIGKLLKQGRERDALVVVDWMREKINVIVTLKLNEGWTYEADSTD